MILVIVKGEEAHVLVSGDGCIYVDEVETKIESEANTPDYLAYHLDDILEGFTSCKHYTFKFQKSISICSDGIYSFMDKDRIDRSKEVIDSLLVDEFLLKSKAMLSRKYNLLLEEGYSNYDDLSIVRFIK